MSIPSSFPKTETAYRLAIVADFPGDEEAVVGKPFQPPGGKFLEALLSRSGLARDTVYMGYVYRTPISKKAYNSLPSDPTTYVQDLESLRSDLAQFKPNVVLLLGKLALKVAKEPGLLAKPYEYPHSVDDWRGSMFMPTDPGSPFFGFKCITSYDPSAVLRQYAWAPLLDFDIRRAYKESRDPRINLPVRDIAIAQSCNYFCERLDDIIARKPIIGTDIEGYWDGITCFGIAESRSKAFVVPFTRKDGTNYFSLEEEVQIWRRVAIILADPDIKKIWQNGLYDRWCFQYGHQIVTYGNEDDIMLKHWELYCEMEKSLGMQCSLYTNQPYYKGDRKSNDDMVYWNYNGVDACVTKEICETLTPKLDPRATEHYRFNHDLLNVFLYMELKGILYDTEKAKARRDHVVAAAYAEQVKLDAIAKTGCASYLSNPTGWLQRLSNEHCRKKYIYSSFDDLASGWLKKKKQGVEDWFNVHGPRIIELSKKMPNLTQSEIGELSTLSYTHMNVDSNTQFQAYVYGTLALPVQWKKDPKTKEERPTTDYEALLKLVRTTQHPVCKLAIDLRSLGTRAGMLSIYADPDNRIRCGYNVVGTETGRLSCYTAPTGSGYNLTTIPNYTDVATAPGGVLGDRDLFLADLIYWFFQCDLSGADGWTVAAHLKALGDSTMYDDYVFGLKPAKILVLMLRHGDVVNTYSREQLKEMSRSINKDAWEYFCCKIVQHGTSYLMGGQTVANNVFKQSEGKIHITTRQALDFQRLFLLRYAVKRWHEHMASKLSRSPVIISASGHRRVFFGRKDEILGQALAHEPQANTTYATNMAARRLWVDKENSDAEGRFRIDPLHQVHDALCGQFKKTDVEFAKQRIPEYFNNPMLIAGMSITIPYEGGYGRSWGELNEGSL